MSPDSPAATAPEERAPVPLRVAFLFGHLHRGGMQRAVSNVTRSLPAHIESFVAYFGTDNPGFDFRATMVNLDVPGVLGSSLPRKLANFAARVARVRRFVREHRVDVVVSMGEIANIVNVVGAAPRRILSVRSAPVASLSDSGAYAPVYASLRRLLYGRASAVVAVSRAAADELRERYAVPGGLIRVIPNLYDSAAIRSAGAEPLPPDLAWLEERTFVVAVGTLAAHKGQAELVRAMVEARRSLPSLELVLVGDGEGGVALRALISKLGLDGAVHLVGFRDNPHAIVARALAFALPSHFEGFPNALVEAMLCGIPVVATDCATGPREILGDSEHGLLVPAIADAGEDSVVRGLAGAITELACQPARHAHFASRGATRAAEFDAPRVVGAWVRLLSGDAGRSEPQERGGRSV